MPDVKAFVGNRPPPVGAEAGFSAQTRVSNRSGHDAILQIRILERLQTDPRVDPSMVTVVVQNRSATLFGTAVNEVQRGLMHTLAAEVSGIIEVTNRLRIAPLAQ